MRIGCVILVRYNSHRLPGKALLSLGNKPLLQHGYDALSTVFTPGNLVVATSTESTDDAIAAYCEEHHLPYFRGSLTNVSDRFLKAAEAHNFDYVMRINGDNLFVALPIVRQVVQDTRNSIDFYSNVKDRTFPFGMSVEMVKTSFYQKLMDQINQSPRYQEHVTLYLYEHEEVGDRQYYYNSEFPEATGIHLSIDTSEDASFAKKMLQKLAKPLHTNGLGEILKTYYQLKAHE
ncbi:MAG: hypothetical protein RIG62_16015 [Cyclobacteriaceae bacterium]